MSFVETLRLLVDADTKGAVQDIERLGQTSQRELSRSEQSLDRWGNRLTTVGAGMVTFGAAAVFGLAKAGDAASDLGEVVSKSAQVFGSASDEVEDFADSAADIGLSKRAALEAASGFGNLFTQVGLANDRAGDMSVRLTRLAADFASFHNADITEVIEAQTAAFRGEFDSLQRFVPTINAAAVQQRALADTGKDTADALTEADKAAATYSLMLEGAGKATGDFERTSDSAANQQRKLNASFENLKAQLGEGVLPVMNKGLGVADSLVTGFSNLDDATGGVAGQLAAFGAVGLIALGGLSALAGQVIKARDTITGFATALGKLPPAAKAAAAGFTAVTVAVTAVELLVAANERRAAGWVNRLVGDVDTSKLKEVKEALADARAELDQLDDREGEGRLFSIGDVNVFPLGTEDRDRQNRIDALREKIEELEGQEDSLTTQERELASAYVGSDKALTGLNDQTTDAILNLADYSDAMRATFDPLFGLTDALNDNTEAQADYIAAQDELNRVVAEFGPNSAEAAAAQLAFDEANRAVLDSAIDVNAATAELNAAVAANPALVDEAKAHLQTMIAQGLFPTAEAAAEAGRRLDAAALQGIAFGQLQPHMNITTNADEVGGRLQQLREQWDGIELKKRIELEIATKGAIGIGGGLRLMHEGGIVAGQRGQDIAAILQAGEEVLALDDPRHSANLRTFTGTELAGRSGGGGFGTREPIVIRLEIEHDKDRLVKVLRYHVSQFGGDVQNALGQ